MSEYCAPSEHLYLQSEESADSFKTTELQLVEAYIHEISNQVTVILGISELALETTRDNVTESKHLGEIVQAARRAARATHKLLELKVSHLPGTDSRVPHRDDHSAVLP